MDIADIIKKTARGFPITLADFLIALDLESGSINGLLNSAEIGGDYGFENETLNDAGIERVIVDVEDKRVQFELCAIKTIAFHLSASAYETAERQIVEPGNDTLSSKPFGQTFARIGESLFCMISSPTNHRGILIISKCCEQFVNEFVEKVSVDDFSAHWLREAAKN